MNGKIALMVMLLTTVAGAEVNTAKVVQKLQENDYQTIAHIDSGGRLIVNFASDGHGGGANQIKRTTPPKATELIGKMRDEAEIGVEEELRESFSYSDRGGKIIHVERFLNGIKLDRSTIVVREANSGEINGITIPLTKYSPELKAASSANHLAEEEVVSIIESDVKYRGWENLRVIQVERAMGGG